MATFASESSRFYLPDGSVLAEVPNKSRGGFRPARVPDAIKAGAEPSVTSVMRAAAAPGLESWKIRQAVLSALTLPRLPDEPLDAFADRALTDSQEQGKRAAETGTAIHGAIERSIQGLEYDLNFHIHVRNVWEKLKDILGIDLSTGRAERSFCLPGYFGGKVDWHSDTVVIDFKGTGSDKIGGKLAYPDSHLLQLAAYRHGLQIPKARLLNVFIGRERGEVQTHEWAQDEADHGLREFLALLRFYRIRHGFPEAA